MTGAEDTNNILIPIEIMIIIATCILINLTHTYARILYFIKLLYINASSQSFHVDIETRVFTTIDVMHLMHG